jgi:xylulokinase
VTALVGLDVGTTGVKAVAVAPDGNVLGRAEREYPFSTPHPGWAEQDPALWVHASEAALEEVSRGREVAGIGLSGQMHGLVCLDSADAVIRPAILWNDQRTGAECAEIEQRLGLEALIRLTGNRALTGFTAPKLLWLRKHEPDAYARLSRICLPKDFVRLQLTGSWAIDVADASGTLLLDVAARRWSDEVLDALELPPSLLPPVLESPVVSGETSRGVPVAAGAGDCAAAALGVGVVEPGPVSIVLGTSGVVFSTLPSFAADTRARVHVFCHAVPGVWHAMGVMLSAAGSLQWLHDVVAPDIPFERLVAEAASWEAGTEGLMFLPYLQGERTPHADPDARGVFAGLQLRHDRGALVRAVLEGVAFGLRDSFELLRPLGVGACVRRRRPLRALARDLRVGARRAGGADGGRGGLGVRRSAPGRRRRRDVLGRRAGSRVVCPRPGHCRAGTVLAEGVRGPLRALSRALSRDQGGRRTMSALRLGLISTAKINDEILAGAAGTDKVEVVAVGSRDDARAAAYAAEKGIPRAHGSYEALLEDADVDAVYISLPNALHHEWTLLALAAGKHVLCEKPYTRRAGDVDEAWDAAEAAGLVLMEAFMYRHHPQTRRMKELVDGRAVGRLLTVKATFTFPLRDPGNIRALPELDGGALMDVGCYCVSGARLLAGEPQHVRAEQVIGSTGVDMAMYGTMLHQDDVVSQFEASFIAPARQRLEVVGGDGVLVVESPWRVDWPGEARLTLDDSVEVLEIPPANSYTLELENLADAVAGVAPQLLGREDALGQARAIEALYLSADKGVRVDVG